MINFSIDDIVSCPKGKDVLKNILIFCNTRSKYQQKLLENQKMNY